MVFVTVGTHEQQFDRLLEAVDRLVEEGAIADEVFAQIGYCTYEPRNIKWEKMLPYDEMQRHMREADVVVCHGGPSTFMDAMACGKTPVVVPRQACFGEHVNDHQVDFVAAVAERQGGIIPVFDVVDLAPAINISRSIGASAVQASSNNDEFVRRFALLVGEMMCEAAK